MKRKITLRMLADVTDLHPSTVSRILRGEDGRASAETRGRVFAVAQKLGYQPDLGARSLRTRRSLSLGLIIPDVRDAIFASIYMGAERTAEAHGYHVLLSPVDRTRGPQKEDIDVLTERGVDGLLVATMKLRDPLLEQLKQTGIPFVLVSRRMANCVPYVVSDDEGGVRSVSEHLISLGHRRIAFMAGTRGVSTTEGRLSGYRSAFTGAGIPIDERLIVGDGFGAAAGARATKLLLKLSDLPTAIVTADDMMAIAAYQVLAENGLRVPEDVSVTGYNDLPIAALVNPPLTTVNSPLEQMGEQAINLLIHRLAGLQETESATLKTTLVVRASSGAPRSLEEAPGTPDDG